MNSLEEYMNATRDFAVAAGEQIYEAAAGAQGFGTSLGEAFLRSGYIASGTYSVNDSTLGQSRYDFRYRTFPEDIANDYIGHYMVININVPTYTDGTRRSSYNNATNIINNEFSKVDTLRFGGAAPVASSPLGNIPAAEREPFSVPRFTRRIQEAIALFMPTPVIYNSVNDYQEISMTAMGGGLATTAGALAETVFKRRGAAGIASAVNATGRTVGAVSSIIGYPINPRVEVLYSRSNLRQFVFEFLFAPRNQKESESMRAIIQTLRYHSAPELDAQTQGFTFIPPAEFDITFYNKGVENTNIPRINTCVLDRIEVDYAPAGVYATFKNGHPVTARLSLGFREVEVLHKRRVLQGF